MNTAGRAGRGGKQQQERQSRNLGAHLFAKPCIRNKVPNCNYADLSSFRVSDDPSSEFSASGKSCSPSPAVLHRDFRESSVCSNRSSAAGDAAADVDGGQQIAFAAAAVDGRDERFPSPFNKQGSMVSLVVSVFVYLARK